MLRPGDVVGGDFEIQGQLSRGGMGAVFTARQRSTDMLRVIKVMLPNLVQSSELRERFEREARASGRIASEHVVKPIAYGVDPRLGIPWLAMEHLQGATLDARLFEYGVPPKRVCVELLRQLFHGVAAAHAAGIVHRDLKPGNVFVADALRADVPFTVKVLDFGIAKLVTSAPQATRAMGTRAWMAPEQERSDLAIDPSADVWALGLLTFWLLSGRHFWRFAEGPESRLSYEVHFEPIPSASTRATEFGVGPMWEPFDVWFSHCVTRERGERFQDGAAAWHALARVLSDIPEWSAGGPRAAAPSGPASVTEPERTSAWPGRASMPSGAPSSPTQLPVPKTTTAPMSADPRRMAPPPGTGMVKSALMLLLGGVLVATGTFLARDWSSKPEEELVPPATPAASGSPALEMASPAPATAPRSNIAPSSSDEHPAATNTVLPTRPLAPALVAPDGMVYVPPGTFVMGHGDAPPEGPERRVAITRGFFIDRHEVSVGEYRVCLKAKRCTPNGVHGPRPTQEEVEKFMPLCTGVEAGHDDLPISCIDHGQASAYCRFRNKRLPTEAEWEYAARGADGRDYPWGNEAPSRCGVAVVSGLCPAAGARAVGLRDANSASPFGAFDMSGNVWEWVEDIYDPQAYTTLPATDPIARGVIERGVVRGGSWDFTSTLARTWHRQPLDRREGHVSTGVRCALDAVAAPVPTTPSAK